MAAMAGSALGAGVLPGTAWAGATMPVAAPNGESVHAAGRRRGLRILILGGTGFLGPHIVRAAIEGGHEVTLFNRGRSQPSLNIPFFTGLETLIGDRDGDITALSGRRWDAVIDTSGYTPDQVRATAQLLRGSVGQYLFTSTRAVYADFTASPMDESAPVGMRGVPESEWRGYGPLKVLAEREVQRAFPDRTTILRPCIITGPGDTTDRFTYWYVRVERGGQVLAPGDPTDPLHYVDVRDLAEFYVHLLEQRTPGVFNLVAPHGILTSAEFLYACRAATSSPVSFTWVDWDFLEARGLQGTSRELPGWRAPRGLWVNNGRVENSRAIAAGLTFRPLATTVSDTLAWWHTRPADDRAAPRVGLSQEQERTLLEAWRRRATG